MKMLKMFVAAALSLFGVSAFAALPATVATEAATVGTDALALGGNFNGLPVLAVQIIFLSGLPQGMGIILSALSARIALMQLKKIQLL